MNENNWETNNTDSYNSTTESSSSEPHAEPVTGYVQPQQPVYTHHFDNRPPQYEPVQNRKKEKKSVGRGALALVLILSIILSIAGGFAGAYFEKRVFENGQSGSSVLYESVDLPAIEGTSQADNIISKVAAFAQASVVEIKTESVVTGHFMSQYVSTGAGSGVIISIDGYIVTCNHVIQNANTITVRTYDGKDYKATIVGSDSKTDIAVLKIEANGLQAAVFGDSDSLIVGEPSIVIGNPLGSLGGTVTDGIISSLSREVIINEQSMTLLQTDAAINPGNSGGGMFNSKGELVGIVNAKSYGETIEGLGFAIPVNTAKPVISSLIENGYVTGRPGLGIKALSITDAQTAATYGVSRYGVYVYSVNPGLGAEKAGLKVSDCIVSVNDYAISSLADITAALQGKSVGDTVKVQIIRDGKVLAANVELSEIPAE